MKVKGLLISHWENGITKVVAELDLNTGKLFVDDFVAETNLGILSREIFIDDCSGDEYDICPICHKYILHEVDGIDFEDIPECSDIHCKYNDYGNTNDAEWCAN